MNIFKPVGELKKEQLVCDVIISLETCTENGVVAFSEDKKYSINYIKAKAEAIPFVNDIV